MDVLRPLFLSLYYKVSVTFVCANNHIIVSSQYSLCAVALYSKVEVSIITVVLRMTHSLIFRECVAIFEMRISQDRKNEADSRNESR